MDPIADINGFDSKRETALVRLVLVAALTTLLGVCALGQGAAISTTEDGQTLIIDDAGSEVLAFGKNVIVKKHAQGVFAFGGDIIVEGTVDADVATIGGSVTQREGALIGGDVIVIGGTFNAEGKQPLRNPEKQTVVFGVFEEEFRSFAQNPSSIFSPALTWSFVAQRVLSILFWFVITFTLTTISPGGVSRAAARFQLGSAKVLGLGIAGLLGTGAAILLSAAYLPGYLAGLVPLMIIFLLFLAFIFGRVALQVSFGKFLQKHLIPDNMQSETLAILLGVVGWTLILSVPYLWTLALIVVFAASVGLVFTARSGNPWQTP